MLKSCLSEVKVRSNLGQILLLHAVRYRQLIPMSIITHPNIHYDVSVAFATLILRKIRYFIEQKVFEGFTNNNWTFSVGDKVYALRVS